MSNSLTRLILVLIVMAVVDALHAQTSPSYTDTVFNEYFRRTTDWVAGDGSISVPLPSGKTLWLMGDSNIGGYNASDTTIQCLFQVRNTILVQNILAPEQFSTILDNTSTGIDRTPIKSAISDGTYFWPSHGYAKNDTAVIFWQQNTGTDLKHLATYVSKIVTRNLNDASSVKLLSRLSTPAEVEFGTAVLVDSADRYIYIYGMVKDWIVFRPRIARIGFNKDITGKWEFYNGSTWTSDKSKSAQLMGTTNDYVSPSFSVVKLQGKYYLFSQDVGFLTCGLGRDIYSWQSDRPEGPFTNKKLLYTIEDKYKGEYMTTYNATAHPEFIHNNEILISYNVNGACTSYCSGNVFTDRSNADLYRPKFVRVPLDYINPDLNVPDPVYPIQVITGLSTASPDAQLFDVYPNPGAGKINVEAMNQDASGEANTMSIIVRDALGQRLLSQSTSGSKMTFELQAKGIFFIYVTKGSSSQIIKVLNQ